MFGKILCQIYFLFPRYRDIDVQLPQILVISLEVAFQIRQDTTSRLLHIVNFLSCFMIAVVNSSKAEVMCTLR